MNMHPESHTCGFRRFISMLAGISKAMYGTKKIVNAVSARAG